MRREGTRFNVRTNQTVKRCPLCTKWHCHPKDDENVDYENFIQRYNSDRAFRKEVNILYAEKIKKKNQSPNEDDEENGMDGQEENHPSATTTSRKCSHKKAHQEEMNSEDGHEHHHYSIPEDFTPQKYKRHIGGYIDRHVGYSRADHKHNDDNGQKDEREFSRKNKYFVKNLTRFDFKL